MPPIPAEDEEEYGAGSGSDVDDEDLDDELGLPYVLANIGLKEKRELFRFKKSHTDFDWEKEVLRRSDMLNRKIDMERLQRMTKGTADTSNADAAAAKRGPKTAPTPSGKSSKGLVRKRRIDDDELEDGEDKEDESEPMRKRSTRPSAVAASAKKVSRSQVDLEDEDAEEEEEPAASEDGSDNDLFDSDEEAAISSRFKGNGEDDEDEEEEEAPTIKGRLKRGSAVEEKRKERPKASWDDDAEEEEGSDDDVRRNKSRTMPRGRDRKQADSDDDSDSARRGERERDRDERDRLEREEDDNSPEADLLEHQKIMLTREKLESWINEPFFEKAVEGAFVRVVIGNLADGDNTKSVYRIGTISKVTKGGAKYKLSHYKAVTDYRLSVAIGKHIRSIRMTVVSNSRATPHEFETYRSEIDKARGYKMLSSKEAANQLKRMLAAVTHQYTTQEIDAMVMLKHGYNTSVITTDETNAMAQLKRKMDIARAEKDYVNLELIGKAIQSLEDDIKKHKLQAELMSSKQVSVNLRNKTANFEKDIQAGVIKRQKEADAISKGSQSAANDPFIRRETRPKILWNTGSKLQAAKDKTATVALAVPVVVPKVEERAKRDREKALKAEKEKKAEEDSWRIGSISLDEVRSRVKARLGVDPYEMAKEDRRERYLRKVCMGLPPIDSAEREVLRRGLSLAAWVDRERERTEEAAALEEDIPDQ